MLVEILLEVGRRKSLITYTQLACELNTRAGRRVIPEKGRGLGRAVSKLLHPVCSWFFRNYGVLPGSVVVLRKTGMPSDGYFRFLELMGLQVDSRESTWRILLHDFYRFCEVNNGNNGVPDSVSGIDTLCFPDNNKRR